MKSWLLTFVAFVVAACSAYQMVVLAAGKVEATTLRRAKFEVAPVLTFQHKEPIKVWLDLSNNSPRPLKYLPFNDQLYPGFFVVLRKEGEILHFLEKWHKLYGVSELILP